MPTWEMMYLQDPATTLMASLTLLIDILHETPVTIMSAILPMMVLLWISQETNYTHLNSNNLEMAWTTIPMIMLFNMAIPSMKMLYMSEETIMPMFTIKTIGHQWYWSYEYSEFMKKFDSYLNPKALFRLMETDNRMIMPVWTPTRLMATSADVIHSWTVPSFGTKMDAIPGRLNQQIINVTMVGMFVGQCSEICGINHSFMPITVEVTSPKMFIMWTQLYFLNLMKDMVF